MAKVTLKFLAKSLGLSVSSVSKALNKSHEISEETRKRVIDYANLCNYKPNILASSLKSGNSQTIAVVIPYLSNPFQNQLLEGAQKAAYEHNYKLIFMQTNENSDLEKECLSFLQSQNIDGVLISPSANTDVTFLNEFYSNVPLVLVDRIDFKIDTYKVGSDSVEGVFKATSYFIQKGIKKIYLILGGNIGVNQKRQRGYETAMLTHHMDFNKDNIISVDYGQSRSDLKSNLKSLLLNKLKNKGDEQVGLITTTDTLTVLSLTVLVDLGIKSPDEVALLGFSNTIDAEAMNPALSTIVQPAQEMGYIGVEKLIKQIKSQNRFYEKYETLLLKNEIVIRKSS